MKAKLIVLSVVVALALLSQPPLAIAQHKKMMRGPAPATVTFPEGKDVVEIPFEFEREKIVIPVSVNGSDPMPFVLDTGAPIAVLMDSELAGTLDLNIMGKARIGGAGEGETKEVPIARDVSFDLAGIEITGGTMAIGVGEDMLSHMGFEGVIGRPIFKNLVVDFDFVNRILRLYPPDTFSYSGHGMDLPLTIAYGSFPFVVGEVSIDGGDAVETNLVIDTGAGLTVTLTVDNHDDLTLPEDTVASLLGWGANGVIRGRVGRITSLKLGDYVLRDVVAHFPESGGMHSLAESPSLSDMERHGILGARVLKRFRVVFDYTNERLILEPNDLFQTPFRSNSTGLMPKPWGSGAEFMEVAYVIESSPAQMAGIEVGDYITAINGKPVSAISVDEIRDLIEQEPGTEMTLTIRRGEDEIEKKLVLRELI
jgi:predicted aspartyl protease